jgi:hypothetical protein
MTNIDSVFLMISSNLCVCFLKKTGHPLRTTAVINLSSLVGPQWTVKLFLKSFNVVALPELDSNSESLVNLEET